jgi:hypothetical protein
MTVLSIQQYSNTSACQCVQIRSIDLVDAVIVGIAVARAAGPLR